MSMTENDANIALANQSLGLLGAVAIVKDATSQNHTYCTTFFDNSRDEILAGHPWNFANDRAFALQTTKPLFGYENAFTKPSDCLRVLTIEGDPDAKWNREGDLILTDEGSAPPSYDDGEVKYLAGQYLSSDISDDDLTYLVDTAFTSDDEESDIGSYCTSQEADLSVLRVEYISQVTDVSTYPEFLYYCCVLNLAMKLCSPIKQNETSALNFQAMLYGSPKVNGYLSQARSQDAQESGGVTFKTSTFLRARRR